jgi:hypothetical protein
MAPLPPYRVGHGRTASGDGFLVVNCLSVTCLELSRSPALQYKPWANVGKMRLPRPGWAGRMERRLNIRKISRRLAEMDRTLEDFKASIKLNRRTDVTPLPHQPRPCTTCHRMVPRTRLWYDAPAQGCSRPVRLCRVDIGKDRVFAIESGEDWLKIR